MSRKWNSLWGIVLFALASTTTASAQVIINPTGGNVAGDGLRIVVGNEGMLQVFRRGTGQVYAPGAVPPSESMFNGVFVARGVHLVGGRGSAYSANIDETWTPISQSTVSGAGTAADPFVQETELSSTRGIQLTITYLYVAPNDFFDVRWTLTLPDDNTDVIKAYHIIDTYLDGGDSGPAYFEPADGAPTIVGTQKGTQFEVFIQGDREWDRWYSGQYSTPFSEIDNGRDLSNTLDTDPTTDNGMGVQWNLGAATGTLSWNYRIAFTTDTSTCGNGVIEGFETCDDSNTSAGDGCSSACQVEPGFECEGEPSTCAPVCMDSSELESDDGCEAPTPHCETDGVTRCVECAVAGHCDDGNECTADLCSENSCSFENVAAGTECGGGICDGAGSCSGCLDDAAPGEIDSGCSEAQPICDPGPSECVECLVTPDCRGTETCDDGRCTQGDADDDGVPDEDDLDDDNDGIPDANELVGALHRDTDDDGILDFEDPNFVDCGDADDNGVCDTLDESVDFDGDGIPNHLDRDADGDGITDTIEGGGADTDGDGEIDGFTDADDDGADDATEESPLPLPNTDGEDDGPDFLDRDADDDGILDLLEGHDADHDGVADAEPTGLDEDDDGIDDAFDPDSGGDEAPLPDLDEDEIPNFQDPDDDDDGIDTAQEIQDATDYETDGIGPAADATDVDADDLKNWYDSDSDEDGASDGREDTRPGESGDLDGNGILDYLDPSFAPVDTDGDGIPDAIECSTLPDTAACEDSDGDGQQDFDDVDDDNDGILTIDEGEGDADGDGVADYLDVDSDNDGIVDSWESGGRTLDVNGDGVADDDTDSDGDGLLDVYDDGLSPRDTDRDGIDDHLDLDSDGDGLLDIIEANGTDSDNNGLVDGFADANGNGLADSLDPGQGGSALATPDTDTDGLPDFQDTDSDNDTAPDSTEGWDSDAKGTPQISATGLDANENGIDDAYEGMAAPLPDTDGDGMKDWRDPDDDGDGVLTIHEEPTAQDTDSDGTPDYLDPDDDGDGTPTSEENPDENGDGDPDDALDSDDDGIPDYLDPIDGPNDQPGDTDGGFAGGALCATNGSSSDGLFVLTLMAAIFLRRRRR